MSFFNFSGGCVRRSCIVSRDKCHLRFVEINPYESVSSFSSFVRRAVSCCKSNPPFVSSCTTSVLLDTSRALFAVPYFITTRAGPRGAIPIPGPIVGQVPLPRNQITRDFTCWHLGKSYINFLTTKKSTFDCQVSLVQSNFH